MAEYTQTYWNNLIDQYRNGSISESDRFALEKQALDDPFLFDALEGFTMYENANETQKEEKKKTKLFSFSYMAAAASVLFLGMAIYNLLPSSNMSPNQESDKSIAMVLEDEEDSSGDINSMVKVETESIDISTDSPSTRAKTNLPKKEENTKGNGENEDEYRHDAVVEISENEPQIIEPPTSTSTNSRESIEEEMIAVQVGNTKDEKVGDAIFDQIIVNEDRPATSNHSNESNKEIILASTKKDEVETHIDADVLESEIVSLADSNAFVPAQKKKRKQSSGLGVYEAVPIIGKAIFDDYAKTRIDERGLRQEQPQDVTIEFSIDASGNVSNFHHIFTGCSECGPFAISLLQNSGEWKTVPPGYSGKVRYTFKF